MQPHDQGDVFDEKYPPSKSATPSTVMDNDSQLGMYETFSPDIEIVQAADPRCVWTAVDGDGGMFMVSGMHFVNRIYYYISEVPRENDEHEEYQLTIDEDDEDE
jgi:hypothetical protein